MKRLLLILTAVVALTLATAVPAFADHCVLVTPHGAVVQAPHQACDPPP